MYEEQSNADFWWSDVKGSLIRAVPGSRCHQSAGGLDGCWAKGKHGGSCTLWMSHTPRGIRCVGARAARCVHASSAALTLHLPDDRHTVVQENTSNCFSSFSAVSLWAGEEVSG